MKHYKEILKLIEIRHDARRTRKERQEAEAMLWWALWAAVKRGTK
jgi:hypothetical protein